MTYDSTLHWYNLAFDAGDDMPPMSVVRFAAAPRPPPAGSRAHPQHFYSIAAPVGCRVPPPPPPPPPRPPLQPASPWAWVRAARCLWGGVRRFGYWSGGGEGGLLQPAVETVGQYACDYNGVTNMIIME